MSEGECWFRNVREWEKRRFWDPHGREALKKKEEEEAVFSLSLCSASTLSWKQGPLIGFLLKLLDLLFSIVLALSY